MKILIVGQHYWPESFRITEVAESLSRAGCTVTVLTGQPNYPTGKTFPGYSAARILRETKEGVGIYRVPQFPRGAGKAWQLISNYLSFVVFSLVLGPWLLRGLRFDAVLVYAPGPILQALPGILIGRIKGAAVCTWIQDLWPESLEVTGFVRNPRLLRAIAVLVRWVYRHNDLLLVQSQAFMAKVKPMAGSVPVAYHPNPGELPAAQSGLNEDTGIKLAAEFNILFAGNLGAAQALETILDAAEITKDAHGLRWVIVGSGRRAQWLADEIQRRQLTQVQLTGWVDPHKMPALLAQASVLLVTLNRSPIMSLTVPTKIQAYLAAGRPIIASIDGEGARVVTEAAAGLACPAQDALALAAAARDLLHRTPEALDRFGLAGRRYYETNFDPDVLTGRLKSLLHDAAIRRREGAQTAGSKMDKPPS